MAPQLHETQMGKKFFQGDFPRLVETVEKLTKQIEEIQERGLKGSMKVSENPSLAGSRDAWKFVNKHLSGRAREAFLVVGLDARHRAISAEVISEGTLTQSLVHPREVVLALLTPGGEKSHPAAFLVAHNHPSQDASPSIQDDEVTKRLREVGELMAIPMLDHIVATEKEYYSYADEGWRRIRDR